MNPDGSAAPVRLYVGPVTFGGDGGPTRPGVVSLRWEPEPRLEFEIEAEAGYDDEIMSRPGWDEHGVTLRLGDGRECLSRPDRWDHWEDRVRTRGLVEPVSFAKRTIVNRVRTHVVNLPLVNSPQIIIMTAGGWRLRLRDLGSGDIADRSYFVTGSLVVEREDFGAFDPEQATAVLEAFDHFATISQGAWATHALSIGTGPTGRIEWERWEVGRVDRSETGDGWATQTPDGPYLLSEMWPGFLEKWDTVEWQSTLRTLATLLAEATAHTDGEAALLTIDVVLELLSWAVVVRDGGMVSAEGHDRLQGPDRLRLLLSVTGIDKPVPDTLSELAEAAARMKWVDGPHAIAQIRDMIVHPRRRASLQDIPPPALGEAQLLARDYAHGALAFLFGASGWKSWILDQ